MAPTPKKPSRTPAKDTGSFTAEEREAMRDRAREARAARSGKGNDEAAVLEKIAQMAEPDRTMARRVHQLVRTAAPGLAPRLWYGMPAYAKEGSVLCFFQGARKFKVRYATLGFSDKAMLDDGACWPTAFAIGELTPAVEARLTALVRQASGPAT